MLSSQSRAQFPISLFTQAALVSALLLISFHHPVQAQGVGSSRGDIGGTGGSRAIQGRIYLPGARKDVRLKVELQTPESGSRRDVTDDDGSFSFNGLQPGNYVIVVEGNDEFETAVERVSLYREVGMPTTIIPIYLKPNRRIALKGVPQNAADLYLKGMDAVGKGNAKKAIELLTAAIAAHPKFPQALSELGQLYLKQNDVEKAVEVLSEAAKLIPDDFSTRLNYGFALMNKKQFEMAEVELREAVKKSPDAPIVHMYLGITLATLKQNEEAEKELLQAVSLPGGDGLAQAHRYLGGILWSKREYSKAADELEKYLKLSPNARDSERTREAIKELRSKAQTN
jgi:TolA-binding protein